MSTESMLIEDSGDANVVAETLKESAVWAWLTGDDERLQKISELFYFFFGVYLPAPKI